MKAAWINISTLGRMLPIRRSLPKPRMIYPVVTGVTILAVLFAGGSGCVSREQIREEVRTKRSEAYRDWAQRRREREDMQVEISGELNLRDALKLAVTYNKQLQATAQEEEVARGRIVESYSNILPSVDAKADYTRLDRVATFDVGGGQTVSTGFLDNYSVNLDVTQPLYRGGAISASIRAARIFSLLSEETVRQQYQQTIFQVVSAYYEVLLARELYQANKDAVESAEGQLKDIKARRAQRLASQFEVLRGQVDVSNFRAEMIQQQNRINRAKTRLLKEMGVSQRSDVNLVDELDYEPYKIEMAQAVRVAFQNRPDLYLAQYSMGLQEKAVQIAKSEYWPEVDGKFSQRLTKPAPRTTNENEWGDAWEAGITVKWPLFSGLGREGRIIQQEQEKLSEFIRVHVDMIEGNVEFIKLYISQYGMSTSANPMLKDISNLKTTVAEKLENLIKAGIQKQIFRRVHPEIVA